MREFEVEKALKDAINETPAGKKVAINFRGNPQIIDVEMTFRGGWIVTQTIIPGRNFEFTRGEDGYLISIRITINPFSGIEDV